MINKDTKLFGSFSDNPGNNGCIFFNDAFQKNGIDAIYKSFYATDLLSIIKSTLTLKFSGFALSKPHKENVVKHLDVIDDSVRNIGASNTVIIKENKLWGYNTDWVGVYKFFENKNLNHVNIIGTGGFAKSIMYSFSKLNISFSIVSRIDIPNIDDVEGQYFINATPADIVSNKNIIIDGRPFTETGKEIFLHQAKEQFKLYTGIEYV